VLTPGVSGAGNLSARALEGFLLGAAYGLLVYGEQLKNYLRFRLEEGRDYKNRLPDEFYWGVMEKRLR
jgi:hypothetical protein